MDALWLGVSGDKTDDYLLDRVEEALRLIKQHDPARYRRLQRDMKRIFIHHLFGVRGSFSSALSRCDLDFRYVRSSSAELIASTIVHEATHAHPCLRKFGYPEALRYRIEQICMRQELSFARKLPEGDRAIEDAERMLTLAPSVWTTEELGKSRRDGAFAAARDVGIPDWLTNSLLTIRKAYERLRRIQS